MIVYKASDVKLSWEHFENGEGHTHSAPKTCGYVKEESGTMNLYHYKINTNSQYKHCDY